MGQVLIIFKGFFIFQLLQGDKKHTEYLTYIISFNPQNNSLTYEECQGQEREFAHLQIGN